MEYITIFHNLNITDKEIIKIKTLFDEITSTDLNLSLSESVIKLESN